MKEQVTKRTKVIMVVAAALAATSAFAASREEKGPKPESVVIEPRVIPEPRVVPEPPVPPPSSGFETQIWADRRVYEIGDLMRIHFRVTRPCNVYIFNTDTRGVTRQLFPNHFDADSRVVPGRRYSIPDANYRLRVTGPPGQEELSIVAMRDRAVFFEDRHRFGPEEPFPVYPEGAKGFLREYKREQQEGGAARPEDVRERGNRERAVKRPEAMPERRPDSAEGGRRPESIAVEPAPRTIVVEPPAVVYDRDYAEAYTSFRVVRSYGEPPVEYFGRMRVESSPPGARVYVDDDYIGRTPLLLRRIELGVHSIRVSLPGYQTWEQDIDVREGREVVVDVRLRPRRGFIIDFWP